MALMPIEQALSLILQDVPPPSVEEAPLSQGAGRTLAAPLSARLTQPPFDSASMDGYAVRAADIAKAPAAVLRIIGEAAAGRGFDGAASEGEAVRIFTGAPVPAGADCVVIQENTRAEGGQVTILEAAAPGRNIRYAGADFAQGAALLEAGRRLTSRDIMLAAGMNHAALPVARRPKIAILATGDELVAPGEAPRPGQIISSIPAGLAAMIEAAGGEAQPLGIAPDTVDAIRRRIAGAAQTADILVTIGGASVGDHDLIRPALVAMGASAGFHKIAMRPGKPLLSASLGRLRVLGLPGNPVSAIICARLFLLPLIWRFLGRPPAADIFIAQLGADVGANGDRVHYMRGRRSSLPGGASAVSPSPDQDSSLLSVLASADCLIIRPPGAPPARKGELTEALALDF